MVQHDYLPLGDTPSVSLESPLGSLHGSSYPHQQWHSPQSVGKVLNPPSLLRSSLSGKLHTLGSSPLPGEKANSGLNRIPSDPLLLQSIPTFEDERSNQDLMASRAMSASNLTRDAIQRLSDSRDLPDMSGMDDVQMPAEEEPRKKRRGFWPFSGGSKDASKKDKEREKEKALKDKARKPSRSSFAENASFSDDNGLQLKQAAPSKSFESGGSISKKTSSIWRGRSFSKKRELPSPIASVMI